MSARGDPSRLEPGALGFVLANAWTRQGEWGGTTLTRSLIYTGLQQRLYDWTGVKEGYEGFLHHGTTTYIAAGQFARFATTYNERLDDEDRPLATFTSRFDGLMVEASDLLTDLLKRDAAAEALAREYVRLHREFQPYSYVFGYGETIVVQRLVAQRLSDAGVAGAEHEEGVRAAFALAGDTHAARTIRRLAENGTPRGTIELLHLTRRQAAIRTERREWWNRIEVAAEPHVRAVATKLGVAAEHAYDLTPEELLGTEPAPSTRDIEARKGRSTFLAWRGRTHLLTGPAHEATAARLLRGEESPDATELHGSIGHPGTARGRVRLLLAPDDQDTLGHGDVLVSDMTTPDMMIACRRAGAIVTDRGGLLCHAAIVAREFGIPCVLGTERATRILHDGDLVEVDATRGVVRLLQRRQET